MDTPKHVNKRLEAHKSEPSTHEELDAKDTFEASGFFGLQHAIKQPNADTLSPNTILQLQRTIGNQGVQRLLDKHRVQRVATPLSILAGLADRASTRELSFITIKSNGSGIDHHWIEIDGDESYGWWPINYNASTWELGIEGTPGELNAVGRRPGRAPGEGTSTRDPWHGHNAPSQFHPRTTGASNDFSDDDIRQQIRDFARGFTGDYRVIGGPNCQTFINDLLRSVGLSGPSRGWPILL